MTNPKHQKIVYSENSGFDNYIDPISKSPFYSGESVVLCREKNSLISLRSLRSNKNECPLCNRKLSSDLTIEGVGTTNNPARKKTQIRPEPESQPVHSKSNPVLWIGIIIALVFCFILTMSGVFASVIGDTGRIDHPNPTNTRVRQTATVVSTKPFPTNTPHPTNTLRPVNTPRPTNTFPPTIDNNNYALISCAEIHKANLRRTPGYIGKDDNTDSLYEIPCGEIVTLLGQNQKVDGLIWWKVSWKGYTGWIADHTGSGKVILDFDP